MYQMCQSSKFDLCQDKSVMVKAQGQICLRHVSQKNSTCIKINPLQRSFKNKCAQDKYTIFVYSRNPL
uniref:Uncharacterized protein n=1 Tax=Musa acuminata subsp. malaccensis TaxID=214687 RepID=A0A804K532_MUSAM